jgi:hypothetical protein
MPFQYACFISYRLHIALADEIAAWFGPDPERVFLDKRSLDGGDFLDPALANALYRSVCMVIVYSPCYFDRQHTYCAREYKAMLGLEKSRLECLPEDERRHGLIIPVAYRGYDCLPPELKSRLCLNLEPDSISIGEHPDYRRKVKTMADYIVQRCKAFCTLDDDICCDSESFKLPGDEEIRPWLETVTQHADIFFPRQTEVT